MATHAAALRAPTAVVVFDWCCYSVPDIDQVACCAAWQTHDITRVFLNHAIKVCRRRNNGVRNLQRGTSLRQPFVSVRCNHLQTAVVSLNFSSSGKLLVSVDSSPECNVAVYKWTTGHLVASARGHSRRIFLAKFRTGSNAALVTCGVKHIKFWSVTGTTLRGSRGVLGTGKMPTMLSLAFGAPRESQHPDTARDAITFSGSVSGDIYLWVGNRISKIVKAHDGPIFSMCAYISTLSKTPRHYIASAGKDGCLRFWDEALQVALQQQKLPVGTCIRAVSAANGSVGVLWFFLHVLFL